MTLNAPPPAQSRQAWGPTWAKVLAWLVLAPSAVGLFLGVSLFLQGFGEDDMAVVGFLVGTILVLLSLGVMAPAVAFLVLRGKAPFVIAMVVASFALGLVWFYLGGPQILATGFTL